MKKKGSLLWTILTVVTALLLVVCIVAIPVTNAFATAINVALGAKTQEVIPDPDAKIYFWSDYENEDDLVAFEKQLCHDIEAEGAALLDETGILEPGIPLCPPEGDAGTGMVATGAVLPRTGSISAGRWRISATHWPCSTRAAWCWSGS